MSRHNIDLGFVEKTDYGSGKYRPFDVLGNSRGMPVMVMCSEDADPPRWQLIAGNAYSVHFLSYVDMERYIVDNGLTAWSQEHERKSGIRLSATNITKPFIY